MSKYMKSLPGILFAIGSTAVFADHPTVAFGTEGSGAINTISGSALPKGTWGIGLRSERFNNDAFSTAELVEFAASGREGIHSVDSITNTSLSVSYGLTNKLGLSLRLPYISRNNIRESEVENGEAEAHSHGDSSGYGDMVLLGQYQLYSNEDMDLSLLFGTKMASGETDLQDSAGERFEAEFQPGTGSWDYLLGAAASTSVGPFSYHANILYNKTTEGSQSTEIGNSLSYNAALSYRLGMEDHSAHDHHHNTMPASNTKWDLSLELNGESRDRNRIGGASDDNSGGTTIFLSPGIKFSSDTFGGFLSYGIPVIENQNGKQTDNDQRIVGGISIAF